ncbi:GNAT family N-acetyltransferase [Candidatus Bipolaricaulota bacterium]|nr:GNAT family N-acetyltransferase [Candidatus Bipolaricaulota bacterium]
MTNAVTIRRADTIGDIDPQLMCALGGRSAASSTPSDLHDAAISRESTLILIADSDSKPAGILVSVQVPKLDRRRGFLFVDELQILPAFRRRGIARALVHRAQEIAKEKGLSGIRLLVRPRNGAARNLYRALGFSAAKTFLCQWLIGDENDPNYNCGS